MNGTFLNTSSLSAALFYVEADFMPISYVGASGDAGWLLVSRDDTGDPCSPLSFVAGDIRVGFADPRTVPRGDYALVGYSHDFPDVLGLGRGPVPAVNGTLLNGTFSSGNVSTQQVTPVSQTASWETHLAETSLVFLAIGRMDETVPIGVFETRWSHEGTMCRTDFDPTAVVDDAVSLYPVWTGAAVVARPGHLEIDITWTGPAAADGRMVVAYAIVQDEELLARLAPP